VNTKVSIQCEENLNIAGVKLLYIDLKTAIHDADEIVLKADKVERVDAASLQLFAALFNESKKLGVEVRWDGPSDSIIRSAKIIGLADMFGFN